MVASNQCSSLFRSPYADFSYCRRRHTLKARHLLFSPKLLPRVTGGHPGTEIANLSLRPQCTSFVSSHVIFQLELLVRGRALRPRTLLGVTRCRVQSVPMLIRGPSLRHCSAQQHGNTRKVCALAFTSAAASLLMLGAADDQSLIDVSDGASSVLLIGGRTARDGAALPLPQRKCLLPRSRFRPWIFAVLAAYLFSLLAHQRRRPLTPQTKLIRITPRRYDSRCMAGALASL